MVMGMSRLIDANELKKLILAERDKIPKTLPGAIYEFAIEKPNHHGNSMRGGIRKALRCLEQCQAVDAVPVVRCKDCNNFVPESITVCRHCSLTGMQVVDEDDFCSYGERRTDA
jgi:hypothetical protein